MTDSFLESCGIAYRTNEFIPTRKTLVFIHGLSGSASAWYEFEEMLEHEYNILTFDLRGHGLSKKYQNFSDYALRLFAEDLSTLLTHLKIDAFSIIAHSFGTPVALELLLSGKKPESLMLLGVNFQVGTILRARLGRPFLALYIAFSRLFPFSPQKGSRMDYHEFGWSADWNWNRIYPEIKDMTFRLYCYCLYRVYTYAPQRWSEIACPTLIVHGSRDSFVPLRLALAAQRNIPRSNIKILEGANHMLVMNDAPEIIAEIRRFVR